MGTGAGVVGAVRPGGGMGTGAGVVGAARPGGGMGTGAGVVGAARTMEAADANRAAARAIRRDFLMEDLLLFCAKVRKMSLAPFFVFVKEEDKAKVRMGAGQSHLDLCRLSRTSAPEGRCPTLNRQNRPFPQPLGPPCRIESPQPIFLPGDCG
jgi:hypothetical protein